MKKEENAYACKSASVLDYSSISFSRATSPVDIELVSSRLSDELRDQVAPQFGQGVGARTFVLCADLSPTKFVAARYSPSLLCYDPVMRGTQRLEARTALAEPISEEVVTLIVVAMLTGMTIVLSGAATVATSLLSAMIS